MLKLKRNKNNPICEEGLFSPQLLLLLIAHHSTKPPEANTATNAPPSSQSIQSLPYNLLGSSHFSSIFRFDILSPQPRTTCILFCPRRLKQLHFQFKYSEKNSAKEKLSFLKSNSQILMQRIEAKEQLRLLCLLNCILYKFFGKPFHNFKINFSIRQFKM